MKLAFISDIHSNVFALKAVLDQLEYEKPEEIICLGDVVGYLPFAEETIKKIKEMNMTAISGNYDHAVVGNKPDCGCNYEDADAASLGGESLVGTRKLLSEKDKLFLSQLDNKKTIKRKHAELCLFHGMPDNATSYLHDSTEVKQFSSVIQSESADVYCFGHVHRPYIKRVENKIFINCGSVGKALTPGFADYALVDIHDNGIEVQLMQAAYNLESMKKAFAKSEFPIGILNRWY